MGKPWVLGLASSAHNGGACLLRGSEVIAAVQEERLTRRKRAGLHAATPSLSVDYCLRAAGIRPSDLAMIVTCALRDTAEPWHDARRNPQLADAACPVVTITHHRGHAFSVFGSSGFDRAAVLVVDGAGSFLHEVDAGERDIAKMPDIVRANDPEIFEVISLYEATPAGLVPVEKQAGWWMTEDWSIPGLKPFGGLGGMYSAVGEHIFGDSLDGPGKVMGLAPFGRPIIPPEEFFDLGAPLVPRSDVLRRFTSAGLWPHQRSENQDLAASAQAVLEIALLDLIRRARKLVDSDNLCYAGGVALNSVANERIIREGGYGDVFILPASEDSGTALGAAFHGLSVLEPPRPQRIAGDALGRTWSNAEIRESLASVPAIEWTEPAELSHQVVRLLVQGEIVGWFEGRSELGPRALGQRSILCDPRSATMKDVLNERVKHREGFRPFAPVVLAEEACRWFEVEPGDESPFMLRVWRFRPEAADRVPAVVHCDGTGRVQTISAASNPRLHALIREFQAQTGVPMLLNTSMNVSGEPIVESPSDALWCLLQTDFSYLALDRFLVRKDPRCRSLLDFVVSRGRQPESVAALPATERALLEAVLEPLPARELFHRVRAAEAFTQPQLTRALTALRAAGLVRLTFPSSA